MALIDTDSAMLPVHEFSSKCLGVGQFGHFLLNRRNDCEVVQAVLAGARSEKVLE